MNIEKWCEINCKDMNMRRCSRCVRLIKENRFYPFDIEMTRRFCSAPLPDSSGNREWQKKINEELEK